MGNIIYHFRVVTVEKAHQKLHPFVYKNKASWKSMKPSASGSSRFREVSYQPFSEEWLRKNTDSKNDGY